MKKYFVFLLGGLSLAAFACSPSFPRTGNFFGRNSFYFRDAWSRPQVPTEEPAGGSYYDASPLLSALAGKFFSEEKDKAGTVAGIFSRSDQVEVIRNELRSAGKAAGRSGEEQEKDISAYLGLYEKVRKHEKFDFPEIPDGHLREFYLYLRGVHEIGLDPDSKAGSWDELLALPADQRRYRTCYVLYMQGNRLVYKNPDAAYAKYRELRRASASGFHDPLSLAASSYWTNTRTHDPEDKLKYSLLGYMVMEPDSSRRRNEFFDEMVSAIKKQKEFKKQISREILFCFNPFDVRLMPDTGYMAADVLAYYALRSGRLVDARELCGRVTENTLLSLYVEAKLARADADHEKAAQCLRVWLRIYEKLAKPVELGEFRKEVVGTLGMIKVEEGDFSEALYTFIKADSHPDAALVAERLVKLDVLADFLRVHTGHARLEYLMARRALREGRGALACEFAPEKLKSLFERYCRLSATGNRVSVPPEERAEAFFELGRLQAQAGMELLGYEGAPDNFINGGMFPSGEYGSLEPRRKSGGYGFRWEARADLRRFHYRDRAIESYMRAAQLSGDPELRLAALLSAYELAQRPPQGRLYDGMMFYRLVCDLRPAPLAEAAYARRRLPLECALLQKNRNNAPDLLDWQGNVDDEVLPELLKPFDRTRLKNLLEFRMPGSGFDVEAMKRNFARLRRGMTIAEVEAIAGKGAYDAGAMMKVIYPFGDYLETGRAVVLHYDCSGRLGGMENRSGGSFPAPLEELSDI